MTQGTAPAPAAPAGADGRNGSARMAGLRAVGLLMQISGMAGVMAGAATCTTSGSAARAEMAMALIGTGLLVQAAGGLYLWGMYHFVATEGVRGSMRAAGLRTELAFGLEKVLAGLAACAVLAAMVTGLASAVR